MTEEKGIGIRRAQLLDDLRNRRRYLELKDKAGNRKRWKDSLSHEHKDEIQVIFHKSMDLLISSILLNNSNNNNNNNNNIILTRNDRDSSSIKYAIIHEYSYMF